MINELISTIIPQDDNSKLKLSADIVKSMIAFDDAVETNWASLVFSKLLEDVRQTHLATTRRDPKDVHYGYIVSYLLDNRLSKLDNGEELTGSSFISHSPHVGTTSKVDPSIRIPDSLQRDLVDRVEQMMTVLEKMNGEDTISISSKVTNNEPASKQDKSTQLKLRSTSLQDQVTA